MPSAPPTPAGVLQSFVVGPLFQGVKMVPPGPHVVSYNSSSGQGNVGPATSFFLHLRGSQVVVRRWDAQEEVLEPLADEDEVGGAGARWPGGMRDGWPLRRIVLAGG